MKRVLLAAFLAVVFASNSYCGDTELDYTTKMFYAYLDTAFPKDVTYGSVLNYVERAINKKFDADDGDGYSVRVWEYLFYYGKNEAIVLLAQVFHDKYPDMKYRFRTGTDYFFSPIELAFKYGNIRIIYTLIDKFPELASLPSHGTYGKDKFPPITGAIQLNDINLVDYFLKHGCPIDFVNNEFVEGMPMNALSFSRSNEMDEFLLKKGVRKSFELSEPFASRITSDNVRLRQQPSLSGEVITLMKMNEKITIVGCSYNFSTIQDENGDNVEYNWYKIVYGKYSGWVYGKYIWKTDK
jgi:hypothetical protein